MNNKLLELQQAIREVCTELKELSFGCVVSTDIYPQYPLEFTLVSKTYRSDVLICKNDDGELVFLAEQDCTVVGHKPQLQHILRAITVSPKMVSSYEKIVIDNFGYFYQTENYGGNLKSTGVSYNTTLQLDQQAPEVVDFLHSIICK